MRTPILAVVLGLSLAGCLTIGDSGSSSTTGGGDDGSGSGSDPTGSNGSNTGTPKVDVTVDKPTIPTELYTNNPITVTVTGSGGFSGAVALSGTVVDANGTAIPGWTVAFTPPSVTLAQNGTQTAAAMLTIPGTNSGMLSGMLKITGASSATTGSNTVQATVTAKNQVTFSVKVDNATGKCTYTQESGTQAAPVKISQGTLVRFFNTGTANLVIHSGGVISHQGQAPNGLADPVTEPGTAYEQMPTGTGAATWYCHDPATDIGANDPRISVN